MGEKQIKARDAGVLLEAGIAKYRAEQAPAAQILLGAAETMYRSIGDIFNAGVAKQWLDTAKNKKTTAA